MDMKNINWSKCTKGKRSITFGGRERSNTTHKKQKEENNEKEIKEKRREGSNYLNKENSGNF